MFKSTDEHPERIGDYIIEAILGQGGMGVVYKAYHRQTGLSVALKTVKVADAFMVQSMRREIRGLARLMHRGVVRIVDEGVYHGIPWYAMELIKGTKLSKIRLSMPTNNEHFLDSPNTIQSELSEQATGELDDSYSTSFTEGETRPSEFANETDNSRECETVASDLVEEREFPDFGTANHDMRESGKGHSTPAEPVLRAEKNKTYELLTLDKILTIIRRLCLVLSHLHGEGVVHRDLKPDNVLLQPGNVPVLVDFGLVLRYRGEAHRESLSIERFQQGTISYMSPEQIRGQFVDARTDLYALGCLLFTLLIGRPPFTGTPREILNQQLYSPAPSIRDIVPHLPQDLDHLVQRLLHKEPQQRLGYADTVAYWLERLGAEASDPYHSPPPRPYHYRPRLVGRDHDLEKLRNEIKTIRKEKQKVLLIKGESGVGKTRLLMEIGTQVVKSRINILTGSCAEMTTQPLGLFNDILLTIMDYCKEKGLQESDRIIGRRGGVLKEFQPALENLPGQEAYPPPAPFPANAGRIRLFNYMTETIFEYSKGKPLVIILDDLQWADELSLDCLAFLARSTLFRRSPIYLLGAYRADEMSDNFISFLAISELSSHELSRLDETAVGAMISDMLAMEEVPPELARHLARHSEGNPFFIAEYLHSAVLEGLLVRDEQGIWQAVTVSEKGSTRIDFRSLTMPDSLKSLFSQRLEALNQNQRELLEIAAVFGRDVDAEVLHSTAKRLLLFGEKNEFDETINELHRRQLLTEQEDSLHFVHDKLRTLILDRMPDDTLKNISNTMALLIENQFTGVREKYLAKLANLWVVAGEKEKASACYLEAAQKAYRVYSYREAERMYRGWLKINPEITEQSIDVMNTLGGQVLLDMAKMKQARSQLESAYVAASKLNYTKGMAQNCNFRGLVCWKSGDIKKARNFFEQAKQQYQRLHDIASIGVILRNLAIINIIEGDMERAGHLFEVALKIHRQAEDSENEAKTMANLAIFQRDRGRLAEAAKLFEKAVVLFKLIDDRHSLGLTLSNYANVYFDQGKLAQARELFDESLAILQEVGDLRSEGATYINLSNLHKELGDLNKAYEVARKALHIQQEIGSRQFEGSTLLHLVVLDFLLGHISQAEKNLDAALTIANETGDLKMQGVALRWKATLSRLVNGDILRAEALINQAMQLLEKIGNSPELAECLCEAGHLQLAKEISAKEYIQKAQEIALALGAGSESESMKAIERLKSAQNAVDSGNQHRLLRGQCREHIPAGIRRYLAHP